MGVSRAALLRTLPQHLFLRPPSRCCRSVPGERFVLRFQLTDEFEDDICSTDPWCAARQASVVLCWLRLIKSVWWLGIRLLPCWLCAYSRLLLFLPQFDTRAHAATAPRPRPPRRLVLHKIDSPTKMRFVGSRVANCSLTPPEPWVVPESIEEYVSPEVRQQWAERNAAYWAERGGRPPMEDRSKRKAKQGKEGEEEAEGGGRGGGKDGSSGDGSSAGAAGGTAAAAGAAAGAGAGAAGSSGAAVRAAADAMAAAAAGSAAGSGTAGGAVAALQQQ